MIVIALPRRLLPPSTANIAGRLPASPAFRDPVMSLATNLIRNAERVTPAEALHLADTITDLTRFLILRHHGQQTDVNRKHLLQLQIHRYIERHISDPRLCPAAIAAAHHIAPRTLHRLFHEQGLSAAALIRSLRIERCRRDLRDPALRHRPVHVIATRWGLTDAAHFSRLFPRRLRRTAPPLPAHQHALNRSRIH